MELSQIIYTIRRLSDEQGESSENLVDFLNDAIAKINIECGANFPFFDITLSSFVHPIPISWQRALFIPFGVGRVKQKESSQFEYSDSYNEFMANLVEFKAKYPIPTEYQDSANSTVYQIDFASNPYRW